MRISAKVLKGRSYRELINAPVSNRGVQLRLADVPAHISIGAVAASGARFLVELSLEEAEQVAKDVAEFHAREVGP